MLVNHERWPHKYLRKFKKDGKDVYVYTDDKPKNFQQAVAGTRTYRVVIAHGKPTPIQVDNDDYISFGQPVLVGRKLFINTNPNKSYWGKAKSDRGDETYLYDESQLARASAKKAAKVANYADKAKLINASAERMMTSADDESREYGMAIWLNGATRLRIGAHADAASVDAKERRGIINKAKAERWTDNEKADALEAARAPTFGLLTLQAKHVRLDPETRIASFAFRGKGGKMITGDAVAAELPPLQYAVLSDMLSSKGEDDKLFPSVEYKRVWRIYKKYGATPHTVRAGYADSKIREMMDSFHAEKSETWEQSWRRFNSEVKENISDKLGHSVDMTKKAYITANTQVGLETFKNGLRDHLEESVGGKSAGECLARVLTWLEVGPGNVVV